MAKQFLPNLGRMNDPVLIFGLLVLLAIIAGSLWFSRSATVKRRLARIKARRMADALDDEIVKVSGAVQLLGRTLTAPISGRECALYYIHIKSGEGSRATLNWNESDFVIEEEKKADLVIYDGEHYAVIDTSLVKSYFDLDVQLSTGMWNKAEPRLVNFLERRGKSNETIWGLSQSVVWKEGVLEEGETITVAGKAQWREASEFKFTIPAEWVLYIGPGKETDVYLTDDPALVPDKNTGA